MSIKEPAYGYGQTRVSTTTVATPTSSIDQACDSTNLDRRQSSNTLGDDLEGTSTSTCGVARTQGIGAGNVLPQRERHRRAILHRHQDVRVAIEIVVARAQGHWQQQVVAELVSGIEERHDDDFLLFTKSRQPGEKSRQLVREGARERGYPYLRLSGGIHIGEGKVGAAAHGTRLNAVGAPQARTQDGLRVVDDVDAALLLACLGGKTHRKVHVDRTISIYTRARTHTHG